MVYIGLYLVAIVAANLSVAHWGPSATIVNAFLFIGLDLTSRDRLHDAWHGRGLWWKMALLVVAGSALSWIMNRAAARIALASLASFALAGLCDTIIYHFLRNKARILRVNGSNMVSALVDSIAFPTIAFGAFLPLIILGQFAAKVVGGFLWSLVLWRGKKAE